MSKTAQIGLLNYGSIVLSFGANILMFTVGYGLEVKNWTILVSSFVLMQQFYLCGDPTTSA